MAEQLGPNPGYYGFQDMNYQVLMETANTWIESGDYLVQSGSENWRSEFPSMADEFWKLYESITGIRHDEGGSFFSCSC
jgi:hypothetical protein